MAPQTLRPVFGLWLGTSLSPVARASISSFVRVGHPYTLYTYQTPPSDLPEGVDVADADSVIPRSDVQDLLDRRLYPTVSDAFRYARLRRGGLWVDTDVIALRAFDFPDNKLIFGRERRSHVNSAVFGMPEGHALASALHDVTTEALDPAFRATIDLTNVWSRRSRLKLRRYRNGRSVPLHATPYAWYGPRLVTRVATQLGCANEALPYTAFYPIPIDEFDLLVDPTRRDEGAARIGPESWAVHLWNEELRRRRIVTPPPGSLLETLIRQDA